MKKSTFWFFAFILAFLGCNYSKYDGFSITDSGLHYRLNYIGDGERNPDLGDYLHYSLVLSTPNDSVIFTNTSSATGGVKLFKFNNTTKGSIQEALAMMHEGDSVSLIIKAENLLLEPYAFVKFIPKEFEEIKGELKLTRLYSPLEMEEIRNKKAWKEDDEMNEQIALKKFLDEQNISEEYYHNGIYVIPHKEGKGEKPTGGNSVLIHYKAGFLDGTHLDDTYFLNKPLEVRLGDPDQLLMGFNIGIRELKKGGIATFIIPSQFAFGERGSTNGSVKPFQTLIYEVELVAIF